MGRYRKGLGRAINSVLRPLALELHPQWRIPLLGQVEYMRRVFNEWGITGVVDAGANAGQFARFIRSEIEFEGPILSIEPIPALAKNLATHTNADWRVEEAAVGNAEGSGTLQITVGSEFSSLLTPIDDTDDLFNGQSKAQQSVSVRIVTLDSLLDKHGEWLGERVYLKLDTQGYDIQALAGLNRSLHRIAAAQCEAAFVPIYENAPQIGETVREFQERGFVLSSVFPNNGGHFPRLIEVDCYFVAENMRMKNDRGG